jgi:hypothetical protein
MKLSADKNEELKNLANYFDEIESIAAKLGVEVEDLMQEYKNNNTASYDSFKKSLLAIAEKRHHAFREYDADSSETPVSGMSILKEENGQ